MRSVVINLPNNKDRLEAFKTAYRDDIFGELEVWPAKSGNEVIVPDWWQKGRNRYALVQNICDILESIDDDEDVVMWEDDCTFVHNFEPAYSLYIDEVPEDADLIYLGAQHISMPKQVSDHVLKVKGAVTSHAIIYKNKCIKDFLDWYKEPRWGCMHMADQRRAQGILLGKFIAYSPIVNLCGQAEGKSDLNFRYRGVRWYNGFKYFDLNNNVRDNGELVNPVSTITIEV